MMIELKDGERVLKELDDETSFKILTRHIDKTHIYTNLNRDNTDTERNILRRVYKDNVPEETYISSYTHEDKHHDICWTVKREMCITETPDGIKWFRFGDRGDWRIRVWLIHECKHSCPECKGKCAFWESV